MRFIIIFLSLISINSYANFSGIWQGDGIITLRDGRTAYCDEIILHVIHDTDKMEFGNFRYACGELAMNFTPPTLKFGKKKFGGKETFWNEEMVGKISDTKAKLLFPLTTGKARYTVKKVSSDEMDYQDEQIGINANTGKEEITKIKAKLYKVN